MDYLLFAMSPYAPLDGLCFVLTAFCGYCIARHYRVHHNTSSLRLSIFVGVAIGILLILDDGYVHRIKPQYGRLLIGAIGSSLGYCLSQVQARQKNESIRSKDG
ncbi:MAG: hypothetical protein FWC50_14635 [Planctomycetaceae bacterium]|nr:hypothetical protein [Planctomycetaceae bacterium]